RRRVRRRMRHAALDAAVAVAGDRLRFRLGRPFLLREEQARDVHASSVQPRRRLGDVVAGVERPHQILKNRFAGGENMPWVDLVTLLALLEFFAFAWAVGQARRRYGIKAPACAGNDMFERYFRVQQNTLELLIQFIPALWIAARYWNPVWM